MTSTCPGLAAPYRRSASNRVSWNFTTRSGSHCARRYSAPMRATPSPRWPPRPHSSLGPGRVPDPDRGTATPRLPPSLSWVARHPRSRAEGGHEQRTAGGRGSPSRLCGAAAAFSGRVRDHQRGQAAGPSPSGARLLGPGGDPAVRNRRLAVAHDLEGRRSVLLRAAQWDRPAVGRLGTARDGIRLAVAASLDNDEGGAARLSPL